MWKMACVYYHMVLNEIKSWMSGHMNDCKQCQWKTPGLYSQNLHNFAEWGGDNSFVTWLAYIRLATDTEWDQAIEWQALWRPSWILMKVPSIRGLFVWGCLRQIVACASAVNGAGDGTCLCFSYFVPIHRPPSIASLQMHELCKIGWASEVCLRF